MKIIKAGFSKTFPINQYYEKVWVEAELNKGEDERKVLYDLKKKVEDFFYESKGVEEKQINTQVKNYGENGSIQRGTFEETDINPKSQEETIIEGINSATEIKVLESYALIAKNNHKIKEAYDNKLQSLQK